MSRTDRLAALAALGEPVLAAADLERGLLAVAGGPRPVLALFDTGARPPRAVWRRKQPFPVHALAFHPALPLLAVGTGEYDGGHAFHGQLFLVRLDNGTARPLLRSPIGRQVLAADWLDAHRLRVGLAPPDDDCGADPAAHREGHRVVLHRPDWPDVPARSVDDTELAAPRIAFPRPDGRTTARALTTRLLIRGPTASA